MNFLKSFWEFMTKAFLWPYYVFLVIIMLWNWNTPGQGLATAGLVFLFIMHCLGAAANSK